MTNPLREPTSIPELSNAIVDTRVSPTVTRIGVVAAIQEADNITVSISGSNVLVRAAYLFPQYSPLLGDRVVVQRQGAAWFVLGTLSGPINTLLRNPSFEEGGIAQVGLVPPGWSINVISSVAGVPTFTVIQGANLSGNFSADFGTDSVVAGTSEADVFSAPVAALPGSRWTAGFYIEVFAPGPPDFSQIDTYIQFLDVGNTLITEVLTDFETFSVDQLIPLYSKLNQRLVPAGYVSAPPGTAFARLRLRGTFRLPATSFVSFFLDYMILRQV